jgi:hypothetical protein
MRPFVVTLVAALATPLVLAACGGDSSPTAPTAPPALAVSPTRSVPFDPSHTYRFQTKCSAGAANSLVGITTIGTIYVTCNSWTEIGAINNSPFYSFDYTIALAAPADSAKLCSGLEVTGTGTFKCRSRKYWASFEVIDEGVVTQ